MALKALGGLQATRGAGALVLGVLFMGVEPARSQLDESCVVAVSNRTALVDAEGGWWIPNIPLNLGPVRVRATCADASGVRNGQSELVEIVPGHGIEVDDISFAQPVPVPVAIEVSPAETLLTAPGSTVQLAVFADLPDGQVVDVTGAATGTTYRSSNSLIASVSAGGLVTAQVSGFALISVMHEGSLGLAQLEIRLSGDADGDGLLDDWELLNGLDPNNPLDALEDPDLDGLTTIDEFLRGLDPFDPDTDGDGLLDGDEVNVYLTDPLLWDTDGDGVSDGLEVQAGSDPRNDQSVSLDGILAELTVSPTSFTLVFNTVIGEASRRLSVSGTLVDGTVLDVASPLFGTMYSSSDLTVANFGLEPGRVFAGQDGTATITVSNAGLMATSDVTVVAFSPIPLAVLDLPGQPKALALSGDHLYVASWDADLQVVNVEDPGAPWVEGSLALGGVAEVVAVEGAYVYVGSNGLIHVVDVSSPAAPQLVGTAQNPNSLTLGLAVENGTLYVASSGPGVGVFDVQNPSAPVLLTTLDTPGPARSVAVSGDTLVVVQTPGIGPRDKPILIVDVSDPSTPTVVGSVQTRPNGTTNAEDVSIQGARAIVADGLWSTIGGLSLVDFSDPAAPFVTGASSPEYGLTDVALDGEFALAADYLYVNVVPIFRVADGMPELRGGVDFSPLGAANGVDVVARDGVVYLLGNTRRLYTGRYLQVQDGEGIAPDVTIVSPEDGSSIEERRFLTIQAEASDDLQVKSVEFLVNGEATYVDHHAPFEWVYEVPEGLSSLVLSANAEDYGGNVGTAEDVSVNVVPDDDPVVRLLAPLEGAIISEGSPLVLAASASDDGAIVSVEFLVDGGVVASLASPPYQATYTVPLGVSSLEVSARATDDVTQVATTEPPVAVTVLPNEAPTVVIVQPEDGDSVVEGAAIEIAVGVADDGPDVAVELLVDGVGQGTILTAEPYVFTYTVPAGTSALEISAIATDVVEETTVADPITVQVVADESPTATIVEPPDGTQVAPLSSLAVLADAADDVAVTVVELYVDGVLDSQDAEAPYEFLVQVPFNATSLQLQARAVDSGENEGFSQVVTVAVIDQLTEVSGMVVDESGAGAAGASVSCKGVAGLATGDGTFVLSDVPTRFGDIDCVARHVDAQGATLLGRSVAVPAVPGGATDVGTIEVVAFGGFLYPGPQLPVETFSQAVTIGDFNGDGRTDVAAATTGDAVSILLARPEGAFEASAPTPTGDNPADLRAVDLDGDGDVDLVTGNRFSDDVSVLLNNGDGTFQLPVSYLIGPDVLTVTAGDFDGDLIPDLAAASQDDGTVTILLGNGDGSFASGQTFASGLSPNDLATGDFDGDGTLDLVSADGGSRRLTIYHGNGDGTFTQLATRNTGTFGPSRIAAADVSGDGVTDIVASFLAGDDVGIYLGNGNGTFAPGVEIPVGQDPFGVALADVNADGWPDVVVGNDFDEGVAVLLGQGGGAFGPPQAIPAGLRVEDVVVGDLTGNGVLDIATANFLSQDASLLFGLGDGTFEGHEVAEVAFGSAPYVPILADLDLDGALDLVTVNNFSDDLSLRLGDGTGSFTPESYLGAGTCPIDGAAVDMDGDGLLDLVAANECGGDVSVLLNIGDGGFGTETRFPASTCPLAIAAADFDGDTFQDLVTANECSNNVSVLLGDGAGGLLAPQLLPVGSAPVDVATGDFDGDGEIDLVIANRGTSDASVLLGNGDGTFATEQRVDFGAACCPVAIVPLHLGPDGVLDLAVANVSELSILLGNGDGTFSLQPGIPISDPVSAGVADVNLDGWDDVLIVRIWDDVSVFPSNGDGTFGIQQRFGAGFFSEGVAAGDLDGDGLPDLAVANSASDDVSVLLHRLGSGGSQPPPGQ